MDVSNRPAKKEIDAALIVKSLRPVIREKRRSRALIAVIPIIMAVAGAECNTVIELKPEHHAALPWHFA